MVTTLNVIFSVKNLKDTKMGHEWSFLKILGFGDVLFERSSISLLPSCFGMGLG